MFDAEFLERFWGKVAKGQPDQCWNWTASGVRGRGRKRGHGKCGHAPTIRVSGETMVDLLEAAEARGIHHVVLADKLLRTIARDDLFDAILDEQGIRP